MSKKTLKETNPYLKDPVRYQTALTVNVASSSAVEGIHVTAAQLQKQSAKKS
jgi:hypothetical protein